ncbi:MAG TPA: HD domain-containing protein [Gemmatimonadales bacterium]|nr:HD domain-containing protein [Gemmatimonadales bacterium]
MNTHQGYSDRISHALSFAAKHGAGAGRPLDRPAYPTRPAHVAIILARYGCDETTIVAGILGTLLNEVDQLHLADLTERVAAKFPAEVNRIIQQVLEPRFDTRRKTRSWEASKFDFLASLTQADPAALDVCAAREIHQCGTLLTELRRLGLEYVAGSAPGGATAVLDWFDGVIRILEGHPVGPRPGMLMELRDLAGRLRADATAG